MADGSKEGRASRLSLWSHPGNDVTGMIARSQKAAGTCQEVIPVLSFLALFTDNVSFIANKPAKWTECDKTVGRVRGKKMF